LWADDVADVNVGRAWGSDKTPIRRGNTGATTAKHDAKIQDLALQYIRLRSKHGAAPDIHDSEKASNHIKTTVGKHTISKEDCERVRLAVIDRIG
jgi:hypothetical protein